MGNVFKVLFFLAKLSRDIQLSRGKLAFEQTAGVCDRSHDGQPL